MREPTIREQALKDLLQERRRKRWRVVYTYRIVLDDLPALAKQEHR